MKKDERQVAPTIDGIRRDHVARYEFAAKKIPAESRVIDFACGVGYGSAMLAGAGHDAHGFDIDSEAIEYAKQNYSGGSTTFAQMSGDAPADLGEYDAAICFETIEHIEDPRPLLKALRCAPMLICSVPNEDVMPYEAEPGKVYAYHFRHYNAAQIAELLAECGWHVTEWHGQYGPDSDVEPDVRGRTLIAVCERVEVPEKQAQEKHIAILGLGPSLDQYMEQTKRAGGRSRFCDETWTINALGDVFACDLIFHMDDIRIQEIRAEAKPQSNIAAMVEWIKTSKTPVVTSRPHPDYPATVAFPLADVLNHLGHDYFNSTAAYAVAYAIHIGATKLSLFGMDFTYPNVHDAEKGRACVEFWIGQAQARGIEIALPQTTTLLDACYPRASRLYGYDTLDVAFDVQPDGELKLHFTERKELPTAEQIEANYDHSAPIEKQHLRK